MKTWDQIAQEIGLQNLVESNIHPHVPKERAELFRSHDNGGTEYEFLNLIRAFVIATKPRLCLETGTSNGFGTIAIASGLAHNQIGKLITLDIEHCHVAQSLMAKYDLTPFVSFVKQDAYAFINDYKGDQFGFAFIDSGGARLHETNALCDLKKMVPGSVMIIHDCSPFRNKGETPYSLFESQCKVHGHTIPFSRGLRIMFAE